MSGAACLIMDIRTMANAEHTQSDFSGSKGVLKLAYKSLRSEGNCHLLSAWKSALDFYVGTV